MPAIEWDPGAWDPVVRAVPFTIGVVLLIVTARSLIRTMVIPRALPSLLTVVVNHATNRFFEGIARLQRTYVQRDRILAWAGPMSVLTNLLTWLALFVLAYGLMLYGIGDESLPVCLLSAGSSLFTLGLVGSPDTDQTYVDFLAAATGPAVIALLIGFLPTMYSSYVQRETRVTLLDVLSGQPAWGPEILCRASLLGIPERIDSTFAEWAEWSAQVRLTQSLYPALNRVRSPTAERHWLISLLAVLDAAALSVALSSKAPRLNAALMLENGSSALSALVTQELAQQRFRPFQRASRMVALVTQRDRLDNQVTEVTRQDSQAPPGVLAVEAAVMIDELSTQSVFAARSALEAAARPITLTREEFDAALVLVRRSGYPIDRPIDEAWREFARLRQRYEYTAYWLAQALYAPPAPWAGTRRPAAAVMWPALAADHLTDGDAAGDAGEES